MKNNTAEDKLSIEIKKLKRPLFGRRLISWILFLPIVLFFLVTPILASLYPQTTNVILKKLGIDAPHLYIPSKQTHITTNKTQAIPTPTAFALDKVWNPGELASAHQPWANNCKVCHSELFIQTKNEDCLACHQETSKHVTNEKIAGHDLENKRCADCHRDHMGQLALQNQNKLFVGKQCESCHVDLKNRVPESKLREVGDFSDQHPEFKVQVATLSNPLKLQRVILSNTAEVQEHTGLKFPHDIHVSDKGIKGPKGNTVMKCIDCHKPDSANIGFTAANMQNHCQSCHELRFEPKLSNRQVPHGNVADVLSTLREFYSYVATHPVPEAMKANQEIVQIRPGSDNKNKPSTPLITAGDAKTRANLAAREIFEKTACVVCHQINKAPPTNDHSTTGFDLTQYTVAPVTPPHAWMPKAKFNHQAHQKQECTDCHNAKQSKKASDVLMPSIEVCKDCHVGKQPEINKITSDCGLCHEFHSPAQLENDKLTDKPIGEAISKQIRSANQISAINQISQESKK